MRKVAVVTNYFPTSSMPWGGHSAYQTLRVLAKMCDLHVFYPEMTYPRGLTPPGHQAADLSWQPADVAVSYIRCPALPVVSRPLNGWSIAHGLLEPVRSFAPDVILNYMVYPSGFAAVRIGKKLQVPVVLSAIGSDLNRIADPLCAALTRYALREAAIVTTVSHDLAKTAVRLRADPAKTVAILNGCDTAIFHARDRNEARASLNLPEDAEIVLYVGRLDTRKGLLELVEAVASLRRSRPNIHAYLLGGGPAKAELEQASARLNVTGAITLVPAAPTAQVAQWMAAADVVTLPSYMEGCPNVVIEALASGRPMVNTNVGGIPELMDEASGRLIAPRDAAALASALDQVLAQSWSAEAIASAHNRSWTDVATDLKHVLERAVAAQKAVA